jgi:ABC-2 type transport system permease protein
VNAAHEVLAIRARPRPASASSAVLTLAWRAMLKIKHVPFQLFDVTVTPIMFTLLFTFIFGGALAGSPREYVQYLLPGVLVQTVLFITVYTGVGLNTDIHKGLYDRFRSLPMWQPAPLLGALAGDVFRYSVASAVILVVGFILGFRPQGGAIGVLFAVALLLVFSFALSWLWIVVGMLVRTPRATSSWTCRRCRGGCRPWSDAIR